jgi:hypothetical protein
MKIFNLLKLSAATACIAVASLASTVVHAGPMPACESLGTGFIDIERVVPTTDFSTTGSTNVLSSNVAAGFCRHTNLVEKPGTQLKLTIHGQTPVTQLIVTSSPSGVIGSCVKWDTTTNLWSFAPSSGIAPYLCGAAPAPEPWCKDAVVGPNSKCSAAFLYVENYYPGKYQDSYWYTDPTLAAYIPLNIPHCNAAAPSVAPATQIIYKTHLGCFRKISGFNRTAGGDVFTGQLKLQGLGGNSPLKEVFGWKLLI